MIAPAHKALNLNFTKEIIMSRIPAINRNEITGELASTFDAIKAKNGIVPNLFATFANSPSILDAYLGFSDALTKGHLTAFQRETLALAIGQANSCQYCVSAHTLIGKGAGLTPDDIRSAREGHASDSVNDAIAQLAVKIVNQRGVLSDKDLNDARNAGVSNAVIVEIIAHVSLNTLTNYLNHIAATDIDFPVVSL